MNWRTTSFLVALAGICLAAIVLFERPHREARDKKPDRHLFPELNITNITSIQINPANQFIRVEKTNGTWHLTRPLQYPADADKTEQLLQTLANIQWQAHITSEELRSRPKFQHEFGFDPPQFSVVLQEGEITRHLLVGYSLFGSQVYLQIAGGDGIYLVDAELLKSFPQNVGDWRDARAVPLSAFHADSLEARSGTKSFFRLELNPTNGLWRLAKPLDSRANSEKIFQLLGELAVLKTTNFVSDDASVDFEKFGLPNTATQTPELELLFLRGTNVLSGLQVGSSPTNNAEQVFARRLGHNAIFTLPKSTLAPWLAPYNEFRNRRLIDLLPEAITNIQVRGEDAFTLERSTNGSWNLIQPDFFPADSDLIDHEMLLVLSKIEAEFESDVVTDFEPFGLTNPVLNIQLTGFFTNLLTGKLDPLAEELSFGSAKTNRIYVRRGDLPRVFSINTQEFDLLPRSSWQLRNRRIWSFDPTNVVSVTVEQFGKMKKLLHNGPNDWSLAAGSQGSINPDLLEEAMHRLGDLKAIFWTSRHEPDRTKYGFTESDHKISIELKRDGKTEILEMEFGAYSAYLHPYAATQINGQRAVFEFPLPLFYEFMRRDLSIVPPSLPPMK